MGFIEQYGLVSYSTRLSYPRGGPCELGVTEARAAAWQARTEQRTADVRNLLARIAAKPSTTARRARLAELGAELADLAALAPIVYSDRLIFDHCHNHGWIRGVICLGCNSYAAQADAGRVSSQAGYPYVERLALRRWQEQCIECRAMPERRVKL